MFDKLPIELKRKIMNNLKLCVKDNNYYLVSKSFYKLLDAEKCNFITAFGKKICYFHHKKTIDILSIDFNYCIY